MTRAHACDLPSVSWSKYKSECQRVPNQSLPGQAGIPREYLPEHAYLACQVMFTLQGRKALLPFLLPTRQKAVSTVSRIFRLTGAQLPARARLEQGRRRGKTRLLSHGIF